MNSNRFQMLKLTLQKLKIDRQKALNKLNKIDADIEKIESKLNPKLECKCCHIKLDSEDKLIRHNKTQSHRKASGEKYFNCKTCNRIYFHYNSQEEICGRIVRTPISKRKLDPTITKYLADHYGSGPNSCGRLEECPCCPNAVLQNHSARQRHFKSREHRDNEKKWGSVSTDDNIGSPVEIENIKIIDEESESEEYETDDWWDGEECKTLDISYFKWSGLYLEDRKKEIERFMGIKKRFTDIEVKLDTETMSGTFYGDGAFIGRESFGLIEWHCGIH